MARNTSDGLTPTLAMIYTVTGRKFCEYGVGHIPHNKTKKASRCTYNKYRKIGEMVATA